MLAVTHWIPSKTSVWFFFLSVQMKWFKFLFLTILTVLYVNVEYLLRIQPTTFIYTIIVDVTEKKLFLNSIKRLFIDYIEWATEMVYKQKKNVTW